MAGVAEWVDAAGLHADLPAVRRLLSNAQPDENSACSIVIGDGITDMAPGTQQIQVVVADAETARSQLRGVDVDASGVDVQPWGNVVYFRDPDGNRWSLQAIQSRPNG